jgi:hypothetical protein
MRRSRMAGPLLVINDGLHVHDEQVLAHRLSHGC